MKSKSPLEAPPLVMHEVVVARSPRSTTSRQRLLRVLHDGQDGGHAARLPGTHAASAKLLELRILPAVGNSSGFTSSEPMAATATRGRR